MKWENLQTFQCPYCDSKLERGEAVADEILCTKCSFHIAVRRFESIIEHRRNGQVNAVKMKWQYLLLNRCPIDQQQLERVNNRHHRCGSPACSFHITDMLLKEIVNDPEHPANRFKNQQ